jgi:nitrilase
VKIAAIQMVSGLELGPNLDAAGRLIAEAARAGARLAALPENFYLIGREPGDKVKLAEPEGNGPVQEFLASVSRKNSIWVLGGTTPIASPSRERVYGASLLYDDSGTRVARYDKMHLFRFEQGEERYDETRTVEPGRAPLAPLASPFGRLALSVCYDIRFPELYRGLGPFDVMFAPSAFTVPTGGAHWETLLRARAIENQAYVVAPAQGGVHAADRRTWGRTMIVDPWGEVLAIREEGEGVVLAEVDLKRVAEVRSSLPALANRRLN